MPPHLHPRSRSTTSLFTATLLASFFIVGVPHIFPCPAPRHVLADSGMAMPPDGQQIIRKQRRKSSHPSGQTGGSEHEQEIDDEIARFRQMEEEAKRMAKIRRECPVPKPGGVIGEILGFKSKGDSNGRDGVPRADIPGRESEQ